MLQYFAKIIKIYNKYDKTLLNTCEFSQDVMYPCMHTDRDRQTDTHRQREIVCVCVCERERDDDDLGKFYVHRTDIRQTMTNCD